MHRSGSSLIAQWLYKCGLHVGQSFVGPAVSNADGHFEDIDFFRIHEEYLMANNLPDSGLTEQPVLTLTPHQTEKLKSLIALKNKFHLQWGWKDPRTCLFLAIYKHILPDAYYLIILRDYQHVVSSLVNRLYRVKEKKYMGKKIFSRLLWKIEKKVRQRMLYKKHAEVYLKVWIAYNNEILKSIRQFSANRFIVIDIFTLLNHEQKVFSQLKANWKFELTHYNFNDVYKKEYISKQADIRSFISDKSLLDKAEHLQQELEKFLFAKEEPAVVKADKIEPANGK